LRKWLFGVGERFGFPVRGGGCGGGGGFNRSWGCGCGCGCWLVLFGVVECLKRTCDGVGVGRGSFLEGK